MRTWYLQFNTKRRVRDTFHDPTASCLRGVETMGTTDQPVPVENNLDVFYPGQIVVVIRTSRNSESFRPIKAGLHLLLAFHANLMQYRIL